VSWREELDRPRGAPLLGLALFVWFAATAWLRPLTLPDEGRYVGVAWEMLRSGHWAVPTLDGMPFFHKPPLFYWISAGAMQLFGVHPWAARMPSLLGATLAAFSLYLLARRWGGERTARGAALVLATQPFFYVGGQFANLDMLVAGCITATVAMGAHAALLAAHGQPHRRAIVAAYALAAVGMLAKGLIGGVLPAGVLLAWLLAARRPRLIWSLVSLPGLAVFAVVMLPWFVAMQQRYPGFFDYFVIYHHFQRYSQGGFNNPHPFWFYVPVIVVLALPWTLALPAAVRRREPPAQGVPSLPQLMWCWFAVVLLFFSIPKSKLVGYVLPALPPLAWLLASALSSSAPVPSRLSRRAGTLAAIAALVCVGFVVGAAFAHLRSAKPLGLALREQRAPGEPVISLRRYDYDLPFYARLDAAPQVLDDWLDPAIPKHDDWRKELYDAAQFDPAVGVRQLIGAEALPALVCAQARSWIIGPPEAVKAEPLFGGAVEMARGRDATLFKLERDALRCARTPSGGSARR
jgi:4-amino-4-deoxy-L-arabinose transferase-like glycosyltransferase